MPNQCDQVREIFLQAVAIESPDGRTAYLQDACADDASLRHRVEALIHAHERPESLLDRAAVGANGETAAMPPIAELAGEMIGRYQLLEQLGEGGFGVVYLAEQQEPVRRQVALKLIKPGMDTREVIARFEAERQALALMDHPGIAHVMDAGTTAPTEGGHPGRPYFVMELVHGIPITDYCDKCNLITTERLGLFIDVCHAVQHAHQKGIIHRDLKPSNVLVAMQDGQPVVKVIDFGVAKAINQRLTEHTLMTGMMQLIGTPLYMSPEQAEMGPLDVDTRSDIYSLGVLLYELLTGTTPFERERLREVGYDELRRIIREEEPPKPSTRLSTLDAQAVSTVAEHRRTDARKLHRAVRGDLDWIVMKALDKDRTRRYETANDFARDIERYLNQEPVEACPPSASYRLSKYFRRHRYVITTASTMAILLLIATIVSGWQAVRATKAETLAEERLGKETQALRATTRARDEAEEAIQLTKRQEALVRQQRDLTLRNLYVAHIRLAQQDWKAGLLNRMLMTLDSDQPRESIPDMRGWEWYYLASLPRRQSNVFNPQVGRVNNVEFSPDGRLVAIAGTPGVEIYEPISRQLVHSLPAQIGATWSPDGSRLATVFADRRQVRITIWNTDDWQEARRLATIKPVTALCWKPDSRGLAWASGRRFTIWEEAQEAPAPLRFPTLSPFKIYALAWAPAGRFLAIGGGYPSTLLIWDDVEKKTVRQLAAKGGVNCLAWRSHGDQLAAGGIEGTIHIWKFESGELIDEFHAHAGHVSRCVWSPDGHRLASGGEDNLVRVWDARNRRQINSLPGHRAMVRSVDWSPTDDSIVSGADDGTVRFWRPDEGPDARRIPGGLAVAWSPDGNRIVLKPPYDKGPIVSVIRDSRTGELVRTLESVGGSMFVLAWSPNGTMIAGAGVNGGAWVWDAATGRLVHSMPRAHREIVEFHRETRCVAWSPDSRQFATCGFDRQIKIWEASSGKLLQKFRDHAVQMGSVCWSPDGRWFASTDWGRDIKIRSAHTWQVVWEIDQEPTSVGGGAGGNYTIAWSPDSKRLAAVNALGQIAVWELSNGKSPTRVWVNTVHSSNIRGIAWSPDGDRIASASHDQTVKVLDATDGREFLTLTGHSNLHAVAWSPDGRRLASAGDDGVRIWDASEAYETLSAPERFGRSAHDPATNDAPADPQGPASDETAAEKQPGP